MIHIDADNLVALLRQRAQAQPDRRAYIFLSDGETVEATFSYSELDQRARAIGARLQSSVGVGERVLLLYQPGLEYIAAFFGCLYAGAVAVPAYPPRRNRNQARLQTLVADAGAKTALTSTHVLSRMTGLVAQDESLARLTWLSSDDISDRESDGWRMPTVGADSLAFLQYTSGSTSAPKGVKISHRNLLSNERLIQYAFRQSADSIVVGWLPLYHDMGLIGNVIQPLFVGAPCILMSPLAFLQKPLRWLQAISHYRATTSGGPNFAYDLCVRKIGDEQLDALDLSSWEVAFNGAEPIRAETFDRFTEKFAPCGFRREAFRPCYGLAEATLIVSGNPEPRPPLIKQVSQKALDLHRVAEPAGVEDTRSLVGSGHVLPDERVVIVDPLRLTTCAPCEVGEVWVSGQSVAAGYWNNEEQTHETFGARLADTGEGPFLRTGDLGFIHDGELFVTGRLKDLIIIRGRNHYPQDIELTVERCHAALRPGCGAAFSVMLEGAERLVVVHELEPRRETEAPLAIEAVRAAVTEEFEVQTHAVVLVRAGSIAKTSSGKIQRHACRAMFTGDGLDTIAEWRATSVSEDEIELHPSSGESPYGLPAMEHAEEPGIDHIEEWLRSQLSAVLKLDRAEIDVCQPLLRYGLDSLMAVELAHSVETKLGLSLPLNAFLSNQSIAQLAAHLRSQPQTTDAGGTSTPDMAVEYPLSYGQQALWFLHQMFPDNTAYNISRAVLIHSAIDAGALRRALQGLLNRHAALRTSFVSHNGEPVQRVREGIEVSFCHEDASNWEEETLRVRLNEEAHRPFDLGEISLLRAHLFTVSTRRHVLQLTVHHIIADLWSLVVLLHELGVLYASELDGAPSPLPPLALSYADYVRWQAAMLESDEGQRQRDFWHDQLRDKLPSLNIPTDRPRSPAQTYAGWSYAFRLDAKLISELKSFSRERGVTLYMTLLAAFKLLLARYSGQADITVGSAMSGRHRAEFSGLVGYLVNLVALRTRCDADATFEEFLQEVRQTALAAVEHQDYPLSLLVKQTRAGGDHSRSPLFQAVFIWQKAHLRNNAEWAGFALGVDGARMWLGDLDVESLALERRETQFDLMLTMAETDDAVTASFEYSTELFDGSTIERMADHMVRLLESVLSDPTRPLSDLDLLSAAERHCLLSSFNDTSHDYPHDLCLHQLFERQAALSPSAPALFARDASLSYAELDARANQLARRLHSLGVGPDSLVGVLLPRTAQLVVALLGVLKAGAAYLPLDAAYPPARLRFMLSDSGACLLLTERLLSAVLPAPEVKVLYVEDDEPLPDDALARSVSDSLSDSPGDSVADTSGTTARPHPANLAYLIYTSGSTGTPKGVAISHHSAAVLLHWARDFFSPDERRSVLASTSICFDLSVFELFVPLSWGGRVVLVDNALQLAELSESVTLVNTVPSVMAALVRDGWLPDSVLTVNLAGEALRPALAARVYERGRNVRRVVNLYGPTEDTTYSTVAEVERGAQRITIGRGVAGTQVYVLDGRLSPVPLGVAGELYLGGDGLARGYQQRPGLTAERFVPDPFGTGEGGGRLYRTGDAARWLATGEIEYLGRLDHQVKVRGYRIELGEVEAAMLGHAGVRDVVVVVAATGAARARTGQAGGTGDTGGLGSASVEAEKGGERLVAYVVGYEGEQLPDAGGWREYLRARLPEYMIPEAYVELEELPLTTNGKVDRGRLPEAGDVREVEGEFVEARTAVERVVAEVWRGVLGVERVGVRDNFFDLGGDSILSIQIISKLNQAGLRLTPQQLFQHPTVAELTAAIEHTPEAVSAEQGVVSGAVPLTSIQHWFFNQQFADAHHWNQALMLEIRSAIDAEALERAVEQLLVHHDALRLRFVHDGIGWRQFNAEREGDVPFLRVDLAGFSEAEERRAIEITARDWQSSLNLSEGPLIRVIYFDAGPSKAGRLLLIVHHLAVDAVSWRILVEDLETAYRQASEGREIRLAPKTTSFRQWAERLLAYAGSDEARRAADYWLSNKWLEIGTLPTDRESRSDSEASSATHSEASASMVWIELDAEETHALLHEIPQVFRTQVNEVLLAALGRTLSRWCEARSVLVDVEGHGRELLFGDVDVSRTVGWFTTIYPVLLTPGETDADEVEVLRNVKEQLRAVPNRGIDHGVLLYLNVESEVARALQAHPRAEVLFNYLGRLDRALTEHSLFQLSAESCGPVRSPRARRSHLLEINSYVSGGRLRVEWTYSEEAHRRGVVEALAESFKKSLRAFIARRHSAGAGEATPSDFPLTQLSQEQLDEVLAEVTFDG